MIDPSRFEQRLLTNAEQAVPRRGLDHMFVVDADVHHLAVIRFLGPYLEPPWNRLVEYAPPSQALTSGSFGDRGMAARIRRPDYAGYGRNTVPSLDETPPAPVRDLMDTVSRIGVDLAIVFPNDLLDLGVNPQAGFEPAVARAYARWITERVLPYEPRMKSLLYLPLSDPETSLRIVAEFAGHAGVVGFLVTTKRHERLDDPAFTRIFASIEETGLALGFHGGGGNWLEAPYPVFDSFLAVHAMSFPIFNALHLANLVLSGVPERFPRLRFIFFEAGAAWLPMLMGRLDTAFLMRPSEAPLLRRRPSEYMREFYYTVQPIENPERPDQMRTMFDMVGRRQILFATDYPHWDFDLPSSILDLGFLSDDDRRDILGRNAARAFRLDDAAAGMRASPSP